MLFRSVEKAKEIISNVRMIRQQKAISPKERLKLNYRIIKVGLSDELNPFISKLANLSAIEAVTEKVSFAAGFVTLDAEFFVPLGIKLDIGAERERIEKEIDYLNGFLKSVNAKLSNDKFVSFAKAEVVENERKKLADAEAKKKVLEIQLSSL